MIKFFADTADHKELEDCFQAGIDDGITTNPKIMEAAGVSDFEAACNAILRKYPGVPVSLETDLRGIQIHELDSRADEVKEVLLQQADRISSWAANVVVKIPISQGGLEATRELSRAGVKTNVTACMTPYQALVAAGAGATYVSLFANRMLDSHIFELAGHSLNEIVPGNPSWKEVVASNKDKYFEQAWNMTLEHIGYVAQTLRKEHPSTELIVGSIRSPEDITRIISARPHIITIPYKIAMALESPAQLKLSAGDKRFSRQSPLESISHPMTLYTLQEFEDAANSYRKSPS